MIGKQEELLLHKKRTTAETGSRKDSLRIEKVVDVDNITP